MAKHWYMRFDVADFLADTSDLSAAQAGAYIRLLCNAWLQPDGLLPDDDRRLAHWAGVDLRTWKHHLRGVMTPRFFAVEDGKLAQKRLQKERKLAEILHTRRSAAARVRWDTKRKENNDPPDANASQAYYIRNAILKSYSESEDKTLNLVLPSESESERILPTSKNGASRKNRSAPAANGKDVFVFPDWWPVEAWDGFVAMRKAKAPLTPYAIKLAIIKLSKLKAAGEDPTTVLDQSTLQSWKGLFPVRPDAVTAGAKRKGLTDLFTPEEIAAMDAPAKTKEPRS